MVNMAAHIVAAHLAIEPNTAFQIHAVAGLQAAEARATDSLLQEVEVNLLLVEFHRRQAATVHRDAVALRQLHV